MTDKDKLEKVRAEIERRKKLHEKSLINPIHEGFGLQNVIKAKISELTYLHSFIDSMQEECNITGIKSKEATGKLKECIDNITDESLAKARKQLQEELVNGGLDLGCGVIWKDEKSVSEDLEEAVNAYIGYTPEVDESSSTYGKRQAFKAGANWQEQKDAEAINENALLYSARLDGIEIGKAEMKQQMMAKAVRVNISNASIVSLPVNCDLKVGDKVLIIKKDLL